MATASGSGEKKLFRFDCSYSAGYRFNPSDYVLVEEYLRKKNNGDPLPPNIIGEIDLYERNPEVLVGKYHHLHGTELQAYSSPLRRKECYFFTRRDKKYKNGKRPRRHTNDRVGYWKATGADQRIVDGNNRGTDYVKKTLVYYLHDPKAASGDQRNQPKNKVGDKKTDWIMHEYCFKAFSDTVSNCDNRSPSVESKVKDKNSMRLEGWALCRIYEKRRKRGAKITGEDADENSDNETPDDEQQETNGDLMAFSQQRYDQEANALTTFNPENWNPMAFSQQRYDQEAIALTTFNRENGNLTAFSQQRYDQEANASTTFNHENGNLTAFSQQRYDQEANASTTFNHENWNQWQNVGANPSQDNQVTAPQEGFGQVRCNKELNMADPAGLTTSPKTTRHDEGLNAGDLALTPYQRDLWHHITQDEELYSLIYADTAPLSTDSLFDHTP